MPKYLWHRLWDGMCIALRGKIVYMIHVSAHLEYRGRGGGMMQASGAELPTAQHTK